MENEAENTEFDEDEFFEEAQENGEAVFIHSWDSGNPGSGTDLYSVHLWKDKYVACVDGDYGSYDSLDAAFKEMDGLVMVSPATESIDSSVLSSEEVATKLWCESDEPIEFTINEENWIFEKGTGFHTIESD